MNATTPPTPHTVGILAGMGPAAGVDFARLFVAACEDWLRGHGQAVCDQAYPAHWMAQLPIADRTRALTDGAAPQPLDAMAQGLAQLAGLGARAVAMPCNTAHAWHAALQQRVPQVELLHMPRETAAALRARVSRAWPCWPPRAATASVCTSRPSRQKASAACCPTRRRGIG